MLLNGSLAERRMQLEMIVEAYEEFSSFNSDELALIEPLRAMRLVYYLAWIIRRWDDPAFPKAFPWFHEEAFWLAQRQQLAEQLVRLKGPSFSLTPYH